jgi:hypothetical protein
MINKILKKHGLTMSQFHKKYPTEAAFAEAHPADYEALQQFASGGTIHIKPENKGKFTSWAKSHGMGVQEAASHVMANKDKYSSTVVKRANFAKNASKWKHAEGGEVEPNNSFGLTGNYSRNPNPEAIESNYKLAADYQRKLGNFNAGLNANLGFNQTMPLNTEGPTMSPMIRPDANVGLNLGYNRNNSNFNGSFNYNPMNQGINAEVTYRKRFGIGGMVKYPGGGETEGGLLPDNNFTNIPVTDKFYNQPLTNQTAQMANYAAANPNVKAGTFTVGAPKMVNTINEIPSNGNSYNLPIGPKVSTNNNRLYQGREFMESTGLNPGNYSDDQVAQARAAKMVSRVKPVGTPMVSTTTPTLPVNAMGGYVRTLKPYALGGMFETVDKGTGWKNPNMANAGIGAGAQLAEAALNYVPDNQYTDEEGNVVGSSTNTLAGIGKGAAKGAAMGAALGPWGAAAGAVAGGVMGWVNSSQEEEAAKKAQTASNNRISLKRIRGKANESAGLTQTMGTQLYPYGGSINSDQANANAELELNEQFMLPGGEVGQVNGPSHDEGGIEVALPQGTKVFSDRLKLNGKTYAEHAKKINNKIRTLDKKPDSVAKSNTEMLYNQQLNNLFNAQEEYKSQRDANFAQQFAHGGQIGSWEIIED